MTKPDTSYVALLTSKGLFGTSQYLQGREFVWLAIHSDAKFVSFNGYFWREIR